MQSFTPHQDAALFAEMLSLPNDGRTAGVHNDVVIAFLLFCLEIYRAETT
jgi:hypothetical protein